MATGIITALTAEARCLTTAALQGGHPRSLDNGLMITLSGMGPERAQRAAEAALAAGAQRLLSWGLCGALDPALRPGSVILATTILDNGRETAGTVDEAWRRHLVSLLQHQRVAVCGGALCSRDGIVADTGGKARLFAGSGAVAVDMESAAIATVAANHAKPFCSLRVVVDSAGMNIPDWLATTTNVFGQVSLLPLLGQLGRHPGDIGALLRLGRAFNAATRALTRSAQCLGNDIRPTGRAA